MFCESLWTNFFNDLGNSWTKLSLEDFYSYKGEWIAGTVTGCLAMNTVEILKLSLNSPI